MQSVPEDSSQGAVRREWLLPFSRTATPDWILRDAPLGRVGTEHPVNARSPRSGRLHWIASALERAGKRSPAVLHLLARAKAIPGEARLAVNRFPTRCIRNYYLDRVLVVYRSLRCYFFEIVYDELVISKPTFSIRRGDASAGRVSADTP